LADIASITAVATGTASQSAGGKSPGGAIGTPFDAIFAAMMGKTATLANASSTDAPAGNSPLAEFLASLRSTPKATADLPAAAAALNAAANTSEQCPPAPANGPATGGDTPSGESATPQDAAAPVKTEPNGLELVAILIRQMAAKCTTASPKSASEGGQTETDPAGASASRPQGEPGSQPGQTTAAQQVLVPVPAESMSVTSPQARETEANGDLDQAGAPSTHPAAANKSAGHAKAKMRAHARRAEQVTVAINTAAQPSLDAAAAAAATSGSQQPVATGAAAAAVKSDGASPRQATKTNVGPGAPAAVAVSQTASAPIADQPAWRSQPIAETAPSVDVAAVSNSVSHTREGTAASAASSQMKSSDAARAGAKVADSPMKSANVLKSAGPNTGTSAAKAAADAVEALAKIVAQSTGAAQPSKGQSAVNPAGTDTAATSSVHNKPSAQSLHAERLSPQKTADAAEKSATAPTQAAQEDQPALGQNPASHAASSDPAPQRVEVPSRAAPVAAQSLHAAAAPANPAHGLVLAGVQQTAAAAPAANAPAATASVAPGSEQLAAQVQVGPPHHDGVTTFDRIGLAIAAKSVDGVKHFDIRLDPPELGRVQVHLSVDDAGRAQANLVVDKPQTLELLQRDAPNLNRALSDAGLDLSNNGLNFTLREQYRQNDDGGVDKGRGRSLSAQAVVQTDANRIHSSLSYAPNSVRLDIRV